jgi:hypothetical protein
MFVAAKKFDVRHYGNGFLMGQFYIVFNDFSFPSGIIIIQNMSYL